MKIRRIQYNISYSHIISFKDDYKKLVSPYFGWDNVQYVIEHQNRLDESIKIIFKDYNSVFQCRKDGITFMYEGNVEDLKSDDSNIHDFFNLYEGITKLECYSKTNQHEISVRAVDTQNGVKSEDIINLNPIKEELIDFACVYHFTWKNMDVNFTIGNFVSEDIKKYDLSPFKSEYNKDLFNADSGRMCDISIIEKLSDPSFSKFKTLMSTVEHNINLFDEGLK